MVYYCFTDVGIWASLGKAGITKVAYKFRRDRKTAQLCSCRQKDQLTSTIGIWASLGRVCVMMSRHSCGENQKVNETFWGIAVIKM